MENTKKERKTKDKTFMVSFGTEKIACNSIDDCTNWIIENGETGIEYEIGYYVKVATKSLKTYTKLS